METTQTEKVNKIKEICEDIIKQTSMAFQGGAALYADADTSKAQQDILADALGYVTAANILLREFAINGGLALTKMAEMHRGEKCAVTDLREIPEDTITKVAAKSNAEMALQLLVCRTCENNQTCVYGSVKECGRIQAIAEELKNNTQNAKNFR